MNTIAATPEKAKTGVQLSSNQKTVIEVRLATMELLVGGPYKDHPYGHTALRINTLGGKEFVYDYGRYGKSSGASGEGILRIWTSFKEYIKEENSLNRITTGYLYNISEEKAQKVIDSFNRKTAGKTKKILPFYSSHLVDEYYALGPNCTTVSLDAAKIAVPTIDTGWKKYQNGVGLSFVERQLVNVKGWPDYLFMPADLQDMLDHVTKPDYLRKVYKK